MDKKQFIGANMSKKNIKGSKDSVYGTQVGDHSKFLNSDGYKNGGIDVEVTDKSETQSVQVKGQSRMLPEKKSKAEWY
jgi:hypothetical protein